MAKKKDHSIRNRYAQIIAEVTAIDSSVAKLIVDIIFNDLINELLKNDSVNIGSDALEFKVEKGPDYVGRDQPKINTAKLRLIYEHVAFKEFINDKVEFESLSLKQKKSLLEIISKFDPDDDWGPNRS